jgi:hypothetical protein
MSILGEAGIFSALRILRGHRHPVVTPPNDDLPSLAWRR